ncbi:MAG: L,D-transpeptidase, partial [Pseudomonadota bacterium]
YSTPPAIVLSPDLTSPWALQLQNAPKPSRQLTNKRYRKKVQQQRVFRQRAAPSSRQPVQATGIFAVFNKQNNQRQRIQPQGVQPKKQQQAYNRATTPQASQNYIAKQQSQRSLDPQFLPQTVNYESSQKPGTIIIDTNTRHLYLITGNGKARRYGVGVGKEGFEWRGTQKITRKAEWPSWTPPKEMIAREAAKGRHLPTFMEGGPANPMGARALYLGSTLYRIHGTNQPWSIGQAVSSGCIRMRNEDVMDLYERTKMGAKVIVT